MIILIEGGGGSLEKGFGVGHVLLESGAFDGPVEGPGDKTAPEQDGHGHKAEDGTNDDEDGAFGEGGGLHVGSVLGWRNGGGDNFICAREGGEACGESAAGC